MPNQRLLSALDDAGLTVHELAAQVAVNPKTAQRWISDARVPYPRNRRDVAVLLRRTEAELWPEAARRRIRPDQSGDVVTVYPRRGEIPPGLWHQIFASPPAAVDVLSPAASFAHRHTSRLLSAMAAMAACGTTVRLLLGDHDRHASPVRDAQVRDAVQALRPPPGVAAVDVRLRAAALHHSAFRFDDDMLVTWQIAGAPATHAPLLHLRNRVGEVFGTYHHSFERLWADSAPPG